MSRNREPLSPEILAAYADGELGEGTRDEVEAWLRDDPRMWDALEAQQAFSPENAEYWRNVRPPEVSEERWDQVRARIEERVRGGNTTEHTGGASWRWGWAMGLAGCVVAAGVLILLSRDTKPERPEASPPIAKKSAPPSPVAPEDTSPLLLASDADVEIISVAEGDFDLLLVGEHPHDAEVALATMSDVFLEWVEPTPQGGVPDMGTPEGQGGPMIMDFSGPDPAP